MLTPAKDDGHIYYDDDEIHAMEQIESGTKH